MKTRILTLIAAVAVFSSCHHDDPNAPIVPQYPKDAKVDTPAELQDALEQGSTTITLEAPLTEDASISIPNNFSDEEVEISIPAGGKSITISEDTSGDGNLPAALNLNITDASTITVNTPSLSVNFAGDAQQMGATTAETTLTILAGAKVGTLTVNKGSVFIYGQVDAAVKGSELAATAKVVEKLGGKLGTATGFASGQIGRIQAFMPDNAGWETDRYTPAGWEKVSYQDKANVLKVTVDATTNPAARGAQNDAYYNTQGKSIAIANPSKSVLWDAETKIYVSDEMMNTATPFRVEMWMSVVDPATGEINAYPILGAANVGAANEFGTTARTPKWRTYGYADADSQVGVWGSDLVTVTQGWHTVSIRSTGTDIEYYVDDVYAGLVSRTDPTTPYVSAAERIMLQLYNYNSISGAVAGTVDLPDYSFSGYFADMAVTIYE